jgi:hypothetical protein
VEAHPKFSNEYRAGSKTAAENRHRRPNTPESASSNLGFRIAR